MNVTRVIRLYTTLRHQVVGVSGPLLSLVLCPLRFLLRQPQSPSTVRSSSSCCFVTSLAEQQPLEVLSMDPLPSRPWLSGSCCLPGDTPEEQVPGLLCFDDPAAIYSFPAQPQGNHFPMERSNRSREETYRCWHLGFPTEKAPLTHTELLVTFLVLHS